MRKMNLWIESQGSVALGGLQEMERIKANLLDIAFQ